MYRERTSLPLGSLACSFPGIFDAGIPVEVIKRNSGQSDLSSLQVSSFLPGRIHMVYAQTFEMTAHVTT